MKKSIWISLAAFAIFVAGALAALAVFLSRRDSKLIGDDDYDEYDFDFDDEDAPVEDTYSEKQDVDADGDHLVIEDGEDK